MALKAGDKIKATCGDSVIIGEVLVVASGVAFRIRPEGTDEDHYLSWRKWAVEIIKPTPREIWDAAPDGSEWVARYRDSEYPGIWVKGSGRPVGAAWKVIESIEPHHRPGQDA